AKRGRPVLTRLHLEGLESRDLMDVSLVKDPFIRNVSQLPGDQHWETTIAINPMDGSNLWATTNGNGDTEELGFNTITQGATWNRTETTAGGFNEGGDAQAAWQMVPGSATGNLFVTYIKGTDEGLSQIAAAISTNGGKDFEELYETPEGRYDQP